MAKDLGPKGLEVRAEADARATETAPDPSFHDSDPSPEPVPRKTRARRLTARPHLCSPHPPSPQIVCFPCNQFGRQEPGSNAEIKQFVEDRFDFKGPGVNMMDKIDVNGANTHPVWAFLKAAQPGDVSWNFAAKFIIDKEGNVVERNGSGAGDSRPLIESLL